MMDIVTLPDLKLAGLAFAGPYSALGIAMPKVWKQFLNREHQLGSTVPVRYGVNLQEQDGVLLELVAGPVADLNKLPGGMVAVCLPSRSYAVFTHRGPMSDVPATYQAAFAALREANLELDSSCPRLERYDARYVPTVDDGARIDNAYDILLPVQAA